MNDLHVGIDVSAKKLQVATDVEQFEIDNTPEEHQKLISRLRRRGGQARVCLEATGVYGFDLALALHRGEGIDVMVLNPRAARHFAKVLMQRSKTDPVDARVLREYVRRMPFVAWHPPTNEKLELRALARRISHLTQMRTQEKNRLHAAKHCAELRTIRRDIEVNIRHFERRIEQLERQASKLIEKHRHLQLPVARIVSLRGIGLHSAILIWGELCVLPADMSARQWVAHTGLDPRHIESGIYKGQTRISKTGNKYLRSALYMPAHNTIQWEPHVRAFAEHLIESGKTKMQAKVAVMRKLLHAIHGMLKTNTAFDGAKFYAGAVEGPSSRRQVS